MSEAKQPEAGAPLEAPEFAVANFGAMSSGTEVVLVANKLVPMVTAAGLNGVAATAVAILHLSPQSAKELALLLTGVVADYEALYGPLRSPFIDERQKK
ncbi:hypothetical protein [Phenylobacterium sp.]|uniref:hypothetical protein n=1 Tax=Phenylobacterium sp. TaxID=1871053 RepID=UPI0037C6EA67